MNCKKCGSPLGPNELFCKECGTSVDVLVPGTPGVTPVQAPVQPTASATPAIQPVPQAPVIPVVPQAGVQPVAQMPVQQPVQPQMMQQPMPQMQTPQMGVPMQPMGAPVMQPAPTGKKKNTVLIIVAVVAVLAAVAVVLYFTVFNKKDDKKPNSNSNSNIQSNSNSNTPSNSNSNSNTPVTPTGKEVTFDGYVFTIPNGYESEIQSDALAFGNDEVVYRIGVATGSYETLLSNLVQLQSNFIAQGCSNVVAKEQTINGKSYIVVTLTKEGKNAIAAYTKANASSIFWVELYTGDNTFGTQYLNNLDPILSGAKYVGGSDRNVSIDSIIGK